MKDFDADIENSLSSLEETLQAREMLISEYAEREKAILDQSSEDRAQKTAFWENLITETKINAQRSQVTSYQSTAKSLAKLLGIGIKDQAMVMIPFEIAEATKEMAQFLATKDPTHLAASLKHTLAVSQYAAAAKTGAGAGGGAAGMSASAPRDRSEGLSETEGAPEESRHRATVVVNVGEGVVTHPKEFARQLIDGLNEAYHDDVYIDFAT
jgi:hypothetical protein